KIGHACPFERVDVGAIIDVRGRQAVAFVVARKENNLQPPDLADPQRRRRLTPRALDFLLAHLLEPRQVVDSGTPDDAENGCGHETAGSLRDSHWGNYFAPAHIFFLVT